MTCFATEMAREGERLSEGTTTTGANNKTHRFLSDVTTISVASTRNRSFGMASPSSLSWITKMELTLITGQRIYSSFARIAIR